MQSPVRSSLAPFVRSSFAVARRPAPLAVVCGDSAVFVGGRRAGIVRAALAAFAAIVRGVLAGRIARVRGGRERLQVVRLNPRDVQVVRLDPRLGEGFERAVLPPLEPNLRRRGTSLIRRRPPLGPYSRPVPRSLWWY